MILGNIFTPLAASNAINIVPALYVHEGDQNCMTHDAGVVQVLPFLSLRHMVKFGHYLITERVNNFGKFNIVNAS